ncbi:protein RGF1 INDUCIBLE TRANSCRIPTION FACTOR 1 isoform X1 [Silene latifolia]|uniref:protein RGF1 INDUCIBLE TRANSCRIPTION FACTOR 1 isoform X1 n=1 Tax=Silene latifolia TaxID=37657 RepID=UPI003D76B453
MVRVMKPAWLESLMEETTFFAACANHEARRKNEKNIFCLTCCLAFCPHCLPSHRSHLLLQVRRYVYHDVIRLDDLQKLIDCSYIQPYTINGAKVIFLKERPQSKSCKVPANICSTCDRILQSPFHFCSLSCKVNHMVYHGEDLSCILYRFDESDFTISQFEGLPMEMSDMNDDAQTTENSMLEEPLHHKGSSCSSNAISSSIISEERDILRRKNKTNGFIKGIFISLNNRRKGAPHRSPLS